MTLKNNILRIFVITCLLIPISWITPAYADIPSTLKFTVIFNYKESPVSGNHDVNFQLYANNEKKYQETIPKVPFNNGVAEIIVGQSNNNLINSIFDNPSMTINISVLQYQLTFPINSVPYVIRAKESNKARRVDNESIMIFLEEEHRIGVNTLGPNVTLDINGGLRVNDRQEHSAIENGVFYWSGENNKFFAFQNGYPISMSFYPDKKDQSKWTRIESISSIISSKSVGIGIGPNQYSLSVTNHAFVKNDITVKQNLIIPEDLKVQNYGFDKNNNLSAPSIQLFTGNQWTSEGNLTFTGILHGNSSSELINLQHFPNNAFETQHFNPTSIISSTNVQNNAIQSHHISDQAINTSSIMINAITSDLIDDYSLTSKNFQLQAIQNHHIKKEIISSADISHLTFIKEKFVTNSIRSTHIVDKEINGSKIQKRSISAQNIAALSIDSQHIKDGEILGSHIPFGSLDLSTLSLNFGISDGGTGQTNFANHGIIYTNTTGEYTSNPSLLTIKNNRMGIGKEESSNALLSIKNSLGILSKDTSQSSIKIKNTNSTWNITVNERGDLNFISFDNIVLSVSKEGEIGVGTENVNDAIWENLMLSGGIVLGPAISTPPPPGTIVFDSNQFNLCISNPGGGSSCSPITTSTYQPRLFETNNLKYAKDSSIIHAQKSSLIGYNLFSNSIYNSTIYGSSIYASNIVDSSIEGALSSVFNHYQSNNYLNSSASRFITSSTIKATHSMIHTAQHSSINSISSTLMDSKNTNISSNQSNSLFNNNNLTKSKNSSLFNIENSSITIKNSNLFHASNSNLSINNSKLSNIYHTNGTISDSTASYLSKSTIDIQKSSIHNVGHSTINGTNILAFGGKHHRINGVNNISLNGNKHKINAKNSIAIGHNISSNHDNTVLLNASKHPLSSDKNGQIKLQADNNIIIKFSDDTSISMLDSIGSISTISDKNLKTEFLPVNPIEILSKVKQLPIQYWYYKSSNHIRHIGPTAQDFYKLFHYGNSNKVIHSIDSDGILLTSIKGLFIKLENLSSVINSLSSNTSKQRKKINNIQTTISRIKKKITRLETQITTTKTHINKFEKDNVEQLKMIRFISKQIRYIELNHYLHTPKTIGYIMMIIILLGLLLGIGIYHAIQKLREKT